MKGQSTEVIFMYPQIAQLFQDNSDIGMLIQTLFSFAFIIYLFYAQRIQATQMLRQIEVTLRKVKDIKDEGRRITIETVNRIGKPDNDPTEMVDRFLDSFTIGPVNLDPAGIIGKLDQLIKVRDSTNLKAVKDMAPNANDVEAHNMENLISAAWALNMYYKAIRHVYLLGKQTMNIYVIMQIHMQLPLIAKEIEATSYAIQAFKDGIPIGDGVGPMVAAKLMYGHEVTDIATEMVSAEVPYEGRTLLVTKAKGPGGSVGKPGEAIENLVNGDKKIKAIVMIDAAGKLEGEKVGSIAEGIGAAIGGVGVEKYKIEQAAKDNDIPIYAVAIKQGMNHVLAPMVEELYKATDKTVDIVKRIIIEISQEGDNVIVAGIGNTMGVAQ
jgi:hypothetical protein